GNQGVIKGMRAKFSQLLIGYVGGGRQCTLTLQAPRPNLCGDETGDIRPWPLRSNAGPAYKARTAESYSEIA
ncbi:MAG: hypothetical protein WCG00_15210, partial [Hyphomicrobiales bacterium]